MDADIARFLDEDLGPDGVDVTTAALVPPQARARADLVAREPCVVAGLAEAALVFTRLGARVEPRAKDGERVDAGRVVMIVEGPAAGVLTAERVALNLLMRMSGIATLTRRLQDEVSARNPACRVAATRKTTPGFRRLEKRAVGLGGGDPHRFGLFDAFLVKDNHLRVQPDVREAVRKCRALAPGLLLQVEADEPAQAVAVPRRARTRCCSTTFRLRMRARCTANSKRGSRG